MNRPCRQSRGARRAMTVVEVLAAIALLSLAAALLAGGVVRGGDGAVRAEAVGSVRAIDAVARALAHSDGAVDLCAVAGGSRLEVRLRLGDGLAPDAAARDADGVVASRALPAGVVAEVIVDGATSSDPPSFGRGPDARALDAAVGARIAVDALGRSRDYRVRLRDVRTGGELAVVRVHGLTGAVMVESGGGA